RANFRTGDLTICTRVPMRSVPHRVVCLMGLDDGVIPRHPEQDGDDLLRHEPRVGDRDNRSEDRQLLLDALLAATDHLIVTFSGRDERTNQERSPAVPIAELLDVVDRTVRLADGRRAREAVVVTHPLQPFDPRNFRPGVLVRGRPFGFDPVSRDGARALCGGRRPPVRLMGERLAPLDQPVLQLESLVRFVEHPVRTFLRERLGLYAGRDAEPMHDELPLELDALDRWGVGDRMLEARLGGADAGRARAAEVGRGLLPPEPLASAILDGIGPAVDALVETVESLPCSGAEPRSVEVNLRLPDGRSLVGTVGGVRGSTIVRCTYSRLAPKHRLAAWVRFLALTAARPDLEVAAATLGKGRSPRAGRVAIAELDPFDGGPEARGAEALGRLVQLVDLYDRGMREPLPIFCATSAAWVKAGRVDDSGREAAARKEWRSDDSWEDYIPGEDEDPDHALVLGGRAPFESLLEAGPLADECGEGWAEDETTRLGRLARRLWDGLLERERQGARV
ncbi:MAG TPA: hypothetical protein VFH45_09305, partial [Acidimicrobiales bacterium]|nr:hypothetical protein [Acidimicrobiales bacterium]